jgi:membrane protease subunit (stomatin/prohibitin family)
MTMHVSGYNGQIRFDGESVLISRKGGIAFLTQGLKGEKRIPVSNITSVQFKSANAITNGYIQFATAGGESRGGVLDAGSDENSVMFLKRMQPMFEELRKAVEEAVQKRALGHQAAAESPLDSLKKLKELLDAGVISQGEFDSKKASLMGRI